MNRKGDVCHVVRRASQRDRNGVDPVLTSYASDCHVTTTRPGARNHVTGRCVDPKGWVREHVTGRRRSGLNQFVWNRGTA